MWIKQTFLLSLNEPEVLFDQQKVSLKITKMVFFVITSVRSRDRPPTALPAVTCCKTQLKRSCHWPDYCLLQTWQDVLAFCPASFFLWSCKPQQNMNVDYINPEVLQFKTTWSPPSLAFSPLSEMSTCWFGRSKGQMLKYEVDHVVWWGQ